jgi:hypothetical protein
MILVGAAARMNRRSGALAQRHAVVEDGGFLGVLQPDRGIAFPAMEPAAAVTLVLAI